MAGLNKAVVIGRICTEIGLKYIKSKRDDGDIAVTDLLVAIPSGKNSSKSHGDYTIFLPVSVFGRTAEACAEYLTKGQMVAVEGRIAVDRYEKDGVKCSKAKLVADSVTFLGGGLKADGKAKKARDAITEQSEAEALPF